MVGTAQTTDLDYVRHYLRGIREDVVPVIKTGTKDQRNAAWNRLLKAVSITIDEPHSAVTRGKIG